MNAQLNDLEDRIRRWIEERPSNMDLVVMANLLVQTVQNLKEIDARLDRAEVIARGAANTASCLANGIHPD